MRRSSRWPPPGPFRPAGRPPTRSCRPTDRDRRKHCHRAAAECAASAVASDVKALHFPAAFPEVFLRDRPGFDCLLGNPAVGGSYRRGARLLGPSLPGLEESDRSGTEAGNHEAPRASDRLVDRVQHRPTLSTELNAEGFWRAAPTPGWHRRPGSVQGFRLALLAVLRDGGAIGVVLPRMALAA